MKIIITGGTYGLGKNINETMLKYGHETYLLGSIDSYAHQLPEVIDEYDIFINNEYRDKIQTHLFEYVYSKWKYEKKTIVNILTSALIFGSPNKEYVDNKKNLEERTFELRSNDKEARIINIYPNTLESTRTAPNQKLRYQEVSDVIKFCIDLPHNLEIFELGLSRTKLEYNREII